MKAALRVLVLTGSVIKIAAQTVTLNALAEVPNQYDDIPLTWTSTDIDGEEDKSLGWILVLIDKKAESLWGVHL